MAKNTELGAEKSKKRTPPKPYSEDTEYYGAAEPPVRCGVSHLSGLTEPPVYSYLCVVR